MLLADMGADVVRVDRPGGPTLTTAPDEADVLNRGKRSIVLDLKHPDGIKAVLALAEQSDVIVEGFRPGVVERLGLGPEDVWARNPRLVYGRMTGWGQDGPLASTAGHDIDYIAVTGALGAIGDPAGPPQVPLNLVGDIGGGSAYLVVGILAALLEAARTSLGQVVDAAIVDGTSHLLACVHAMLGSAQWRDTRGVNMFDGGTPYYAVYETADARYMAVGALEPQFYGELLRLLEIDLKLADPKNQHDRDRWPELRRTFAETFARRTQEQWCAIFDGSDACVAPIMSLREAARHPHVAARRSVVEGNGLIQPGLAPRFSAHPSAAPSVPPAAGEHSREVLTSAGIDADRLIATGVALEAKNYRQPEGPCPEAPTRESRAGTAMHDQLPERRMT
jgi:alpha-methylacyl-CoA racemase